LLSTVVVRKKRQKPVSPIESVKHWLFLMPPPRFERGTFGLGIALYNVYPVFYAMLCAVFVDYVYGVKSSLLSIVVVRICFAEGGEQEKNCIEQS